MQRCIILILFFGCILLPLYNRMALIEQRSKYKPVSHTLEYNAIESPVVVKGYWDYDESMWNRHKRFHKLCTRNVNRGFKTYSHHGCCLHNMTFVNKHNNGHTSIEEVFSKWGNKTVVMLGDSLTCQMVDSMLIELGKKAKIIDNQSCFDFRGKVINVKKCKRKCTDYKCAVCSCYRKYKILTSNTTLMAVRVYALVNPQDGGKGVKLNNPFTLQVLQSAVEMADTAIVNFGLHHAKDAGGMYMFLVKTVVNLLQSDVTKNPHKWHVFRHTFPQHYRYGDYWVSKDTNTIHFPAPRHWTDVVTGHVTSKIPPTTRVVGLDYYDVLKGAYMWHKTNGDNTHYCYSHQLWQPMWDSIARMQTFFDSKT